MKVHRNSFTVLRVLLPAAVLCQTESFRAPRTADGKPNLNGIWETIGTANWNIEAHPASIGRISTLGAAFAVPPGPGIVEGDEIPYLPTALAKKKQTPKID
jgi:hypothetical protein